MFDEHLNRQHRLRYFVRGPEWAFAIPQGDLAALENVVRRCCGFWNGVGSLLIPVRRDGRIPRTVDLLVASRPLDSCFVHEDLTDVARAAVQQRFPFAVSLWDGFDEEEIHPLHLRSADLDGVAPAVQVPEFRTVAQKRAALAIWGDIPDEDLPHWRERYRVAAVGGTAAHGAVLRGQVHGLGDSPLLLSARSMRAVQQARPQEKPYLWVFEEPTFDALVGFWNFRARALAHPNGAPVVGLLRETLRHTDQLDALVDWVPRVPGTRNTPDVYVSCRPTLADDVRAALAEIPFAEEPELRHRWRVGRDVVPNDPPTFSFAPPLVGGRFIRGASSSALVAFQSGKTSLALRPPDDFGVRNWAHTRLVLQNLPLPLPVTPSAARRVHVNAEANDGVLVLTAAAPEWNFDVRLSTAAEALDDWAIDYGLVLTRSQDGRDADAVLRRLGTLDGLDVLADRQRLGLLGTLAPTSRVKIARRFVAEAREEGAELDEDIMLAKLADLGLFLEVEARTAGDITSEMGAGMRKPAVLGLLAPLVEAGFVRRANRLRCPQCRFWMLLDLAEQDERLRCRACGESFVRPVADASGQREPEMLYRLDGLMARAMDQDVLPVLLTLRALRPPDSAALFFAWPGVELAADGADPVDVDLVVSDGTTVWCYEVKNNANGLRQKQLRRLLALAARIGARPGIAAAEGTFDAALVEQVRTANGRVLTAAELLP